MPCKAGPSVTLPSVPSGVSLTPPAVSFPPVTVGVNVCCLQASFTPAVPPVPISPATLLPAAYALIIAALNELEGALQTFTDEFNALSVSCPGE